MVRLVLLVACLEEKLITTSERLPGALQLKAQLQQRTLGLLSRMTLFLRVQPCVDLLAKLVST